MDREAIILAGGFGTRLKGVLTDLPKPMAPVRGRPFLEYLLDFLSLNGFNHVVLSTGYMYEVIENHFGNRYRNITLTYSVESTPLGTGGAIMEALQHIGADNFFVFNGDTIFKSDLAGMEKMHIESAADITIAMRHSADTSRYGSIKMKKDNRITAFDEKSKSPSGGWINGGTYLISMDSMAKVAIDMPFSIEKDLFAAGTEKFKILGFLSDGYFIDIGTPGDYERAQTEI
ncbi:MAG: nucleotidyltransferase family protein [Bacteroidales bacterium]